MGNLLNKTGSISAWSYQSMDGANLTTAGFEEKAKFGNKGSASVYVGAGAGFNLGKRDEALFILDGKGSWNYDKNGIIGQNVRFRTRFGMESMSAQVRYSPLTVNVPVGENTNLYLNPHYTGQYDFMKNKWTNSAGVFVGGTQKLGDKDAISLEVQRYNLQDIKDNKPQNWGINIGYSHSF